jgi:hypothetical protein
MNVKWRIVNNKNRIRHPPCIVVITDANPQHVQHQRPWESRFANSVGVRKKVVLKSESCLLINNFIPFVWITIVYAVQLDLDLKIRPLAKSVLSFVIRLGIRVWSIE